MYAHGSKILQIIKFPSSLLAEYIDILTIQLSITDLGNNRIPKLSYHYEYIK